MRACAMLRSCPKPRSRIVDPVYHGMPPVSRRSVTWAVPLVSHEPSAQTPRPRSRAPPPKAPPAQELSWGVFPGVTASVPVARWRLHAEIVEPTATRPRATLYLRNTAAARRRLAKSGMDMAKLKDRREGKRMGRGLALDEAKLALLR